MGRRPKRNEKSKIEREKERESVMHELFTMQLTYPCRDYIENSASDIITIAMPTIESVLKHGMPQTTNYILHENTPC